MDMRTGRTYESYDAASADGVPESDIALIECGPDGEPRPSFAKPPKVRFTKGSFKPVPQETR
jgi:hypothetical protein